MNADKLSYWRYTFRPGFTLIVLITFVYAAFLALIFYIIEKNISAIVTSVIWLQFVAACMIGHYFKFRSLHPASFQFASGSDYWMVVREGNKKNVYKNGQRVKANGNCYKWTGSGLKPCPKGGTHEPN